MTNSKEKIENSSINPAPIDDLFSRYLDICNQVINKNKDEYSQYRFLQSQRPDRLNNLFELAIYEDRPKAVYRLLYQGQKFIQTQDDFDPAKAWRLNLSHLEEVSTNPTKYLETPNKLELEWFKSRLISYPKD